MDAKAKIIMAFTLLAGMTFLMSDSITGYTVKQQDNIELVYTDGFPEAGNFGYVVCDVKNSGDFSKEAIVRADIWDEKLNYEYYFQSVVVAPGRTERVVFKFNLENTKVEYSEDKVDCTVV